MWAGKSLTLRKLESVSPGLALGNNTQDRFIHPLMTEMPSFGRKGVSVISHQAPSLIWTPRTLFFDSLETQKFMSKFGDDGFSVGIKDLEDVVSLLKYTQTSYWPKKSKICKHMGIIILVVCTLYHTQKSMKPLFGHPVSKYWLRLCSTPITIKPFTSPAYKWSTIYLSIKEISIENIRKYIIENAVQFKYLSNISLYGESCSMMWGKDKRKAVT